MHSAAISVLPQVHVLGRTASREPLALFWAGSGLEFGFRGRELWAEVEVDYTWCEPWLTVEWNGALISRQLLNPGRQLLCLLRGADPDCTGLVRVLKDTQAMSDDPQHRLVLYSLSWEGEILPPPLHRRRLEFIGDSLTSGEGLVGSARDGDTSWASLYLSVQGGFPLLTADALDADFRMLSQCGWGVTCGWNNDPRHVLSLGYDRVCGLLPGAENKRLGAQAAYDFAAWPADAVIINLGSNDANGFHNSPWAGPGGREWKLACLPDGSYAPASLERFRRGVEEFIRLVRSANPNAKIVWAYGMTDTSLSETVQAAVAACRAGDPGVSFCRLPFARLEERGAHRHPGPRAHAEAAEALIAALRALGL